MLGYESAMVPTGSDEPAEALRHLDGVADRLRGIGAIRNAAEADLLQGHALLAAGRPGEAEALLRGLLAGLAEDDGLREPETLPEVLDESGRTDEATSLRTTTCAGRSEKPSTRWNAPAASET